MQEGGGRARGGDAGCSGAASFDEASDLLPLELVRSQLIPPAPNRRASATDWLPDFGGSSWIAYGAASLLVISHFPSPSPGQETTGVAPFFRQVIEPPPSDEPTEITSVVWCPAQPSEGEIAAALGNSIWMYKPVSAGDSGSFCWRQTTGIMETFSVETIGWTGSGDGLIAAGTEVVLWMRKNKSWEMSWKSRAEVPQSFVSATTFAHGPVATASYSSIQPKRNEAENLSSFLNESSNYVLVHHADAKYQTAKIQLCHPQPVLMIQWRPSNQMQLQNDFRDAWRDVLLTCCLDGTIRLWSEIDHGKLKKTHKDRHDPKTIRRTYHVIAVVEVNQPLKGTLGIDIDVRWVLDYGGVMSKGVGNTYLFWQAGSEHKQVGKCDWLVGVGPNLSVTFWSIHCLDDLSPTRFPRVTLWKKQDFLELKELNSCYSDFINSKERPFLIKAVASRSWLFGPPVLCSLLQLLPDNSVSWSQIYTPASDREDSSISKNSKEKSLSCFAGSVLSEDGHNGSIIQVTVHPYSCNFELAASLDSNGMVLLWSLSTLPECILTMQTNVHPLWKLLGRISLESLYPENTCSCLLWAPSVLDDKQFLLVGHVSGIDCFIIQVSSRREILFSHKMLTIPFDDHNGDGNLPDKIFATPLSSKSEEPCNSSSFLLLCTWMKRFNLFSWKVVIHSEVASGTTCNTLSDTEVLGTSGEEKYIRCDGKLYYVTFCRQSSDLPSQGDDEVTCIDVVAPNNSALPIYQYANYSNGSRSLDYGYHIATGCSDGILKIWKVSNVDSVLCSKTEFFTWELVGKFTAHQGPIIAVSSASNNGKVATVSICSRSYTTRLHIWEPVWLIDRGSFLLEDVIILEEPVVSLSWLAVGNGQLLLGVCLPNELRIYSQKRFSAHLLAHPQKAKEIHVWHCIAFFSSATILRGFLWGPKLTSIIVHEKHFSILTQWLFKAKGACSGNESVIFTSRMLDNSSFVLNSGESKPYMDETSKNWISKKSCQKDYAMCTQAELHNMLYLVDKLNGSLALFHPEVLIQYVYTGNWNRALVVVKHLVESIMPKAISRTNMEDNKCRKHLHHVPELYLSNYFGENNSKKLSKEGLSWGKSNAFGEHFIGNGHLHEEANSESTTFERISTTPERSEIMGFMDILERSHDISKITEIERTKILAILDLLIQISDTGSSSYRSLDEAGRRFWVAVRFQHQYFIRKFGKPALAEEVVVDSRLIAWAFQSDCQDDLLSLMLSVDPSWLEMRNLGVGLWYTNAAQLRTRMEKLARLQYLKSKNPKDCALLYLALNRLQVLAGLTKISKDERDKKLFEFLSRNFKEEKNKAAALKNAYVLMGRHQLELAIAFFLLGGDPSSAVNVCAKNLGDKQLALVICRLLEGYGGSLERHLISNILLPDAVEKGDYWLSSLLEWILGNYSQSVKKLIDSGATYAVDMPPTPSCLAAFLDPDIGQYGMIVAAKNSFRFSIGEHLAASFSKFSTFLAANALNRCGIPLEALECLSSSSSIEHKVQRDLLDVGNHEIFHGVFNWFNRDASNWLLGSVAQHFELNAKLDMALTYISSLLKNYSVWSSNDITVHVEGISYGDVTDEDELQIGQLTHDLNNVVSIFDKKFSLEPSDLADMVLLFAGNKGLLFLGYQWLKSNDSIEDKGDHNCLDSTLDLVLNGLVFKAIEEIICFVTRYVVSNNFTNSNLELVCGRCLTFGDDSSCQLHSGINNFPTLVYLIRYFIPVLKNCHRKFVTEGDNSITYVLDLVELYVDYAYAWFKKKVKRLTLMILPILNALVTEQFSVEDIEGRLKSILHHKSELSGSDKSSDRFECSPNASFHMRQFEQSESLIHSIPEDERWHLIGVCLWSHLSHFVRNLLSKFSITEVPEVAGNMNMLHIHKTLIASLEHVTSSVATQLASFLRHKAINGAPMTSISWLEECACIQQKASNRYLDQGIHTMQLPDSDEELFKILWGVAISPEDICAYFVKEKVNLFPLDSDKLFGSWKVMQQHILSENGNDIPLNIAPGKSLGGNTSNEETSRLTSSMVWERDGLSETRRKHSGQERAITPFQNPKELIKRSGELFEAVCFNSIHEEQVAVASNKKGLMFFNLKAAEPFREQEEYIWSDTDWPLDGWAGCESTPVPTYVSQGVGLGSKKGAHLGLGGATTGLGSLARPGRDLTGGGAFGIPGYAGIGASALGWGEEEEFEEFRDPPATVQNIHSRALSRHPSRPLLLVGSSNTHVYLWEFGKDRALATYGVLPAANIPPPYALASISALQFDQCGQRFATAALDGTVCTWQLEVGGRSNVHPTDSSLFFDNHASDVAYVAASGSILAAAGCSKNGVNVVLWDTLAPLGTCQVSLLCHEGGARSISVFDNDVGSGSISPLIVTGGKSGDVGLHDFRFIATGKTKRYRHSSDEDNKSSTMHDTSIGNPRSSENSSGMLWYIPKAHLGSVTKIATIPNTSLFLTGSKDGDVKLWDAKKCRLVFHWQKLHDRHTFFQPNSRGFGGVVRAAVTDVQVLPHGFLTCGGDGSVKLIPLS